MSLSKNHLKLITSLRQKKYRQQHNLFVVEGIKTVREFLQSSYELHLLFTTEDLFDDPAIQVNENELKKISQLASPNKVLAVFKIPDSINATANGLLLALDAVNDPGNLGTIIRLCDWFGITQLICSQDTVDCYNAKVVQASMGSLTRVCVHYVDLPSYLQNTSTPIYIADMNGENVYQSSLPKEGVLVMGNEANGISNEVKELADHTLTIPRFGNLQQTESLNVATATAILLSEFRR